MFNLDESIKLWRNELENSASLSIDDIQELESHLLDKIDDLKKNGKSQEEAFYMATTDLGEKEALVNEYKKVDNRLALREKISFLTIGFITIDAIFKLVYNILLYIGKPFLTYFEGVNIPVVRDILKIIYGGEPSTFSQISFIVLLVSYGLVFGTLLLKREHFIEKFLMFIRRNSDGKLKGFAFQVLLPIGLYVGVNSIITVVANDMALNYRYFFEVQNQVTVFKFILTIVLVIVAATELFRRDGKESYKLIGIIGYLGMSFMLNMVPKIAILAIDIIGLVNVLYIVAIIYGSAIISLLLYGRKNGGKKERLDWIYKNRLVIVIMLLLTNILYIALLPISYRVATPEIIGVFYNRITLATMFICVSLPIINFLVLNKNVGKMIKA